MPENQFRLPFEASAYLQTLIGRELVRSDELALVELVKNAYDAGAHHVVITIRSPSRKEPGEIEVRDDGEGMTVPDFKRIFMFAGYSERPAQADSTERVPTGEKGIGRFGTDHLGSHLLVLTKGRRSADGLRVEINWEAFRSRRKKFHDITVPCRQGPVPELGQGEGGTILRIAKLRAFWPAPKIKALRQALALLLDPLNPPSDFEIELIVPGSAILSGPIKQQPIEATEADLDIRFEVLKNGSIRRWREGKIYGQSKKPEELKTSVNADSLVGLSGRFLYFLGSRAKDVTKGIPAGVWLYRDGFRVEPFGTPTADWLGVSAKKAKRAGHAHIVPSRLFGFVRISRREHPELRDTTSREALIDTETAKSLLHVLQEQLGFLEDSIRTDVTEPRWKESTTRKAVELERARLHSLSQLSVGLAHELRQPMQAIRGEAENISVRLDQLGVHDPDIEAAQQNIDAAVERIDGNIRLYASISSGNVEGTEDVDLAKHVGDHCTVFAPRCNALGIKLQLELPDHQPAKLNVVTVNTILVNLLKNAIEALQELQGAREPTIKVTLSKAGSRHRLRVTDNGPGIPDDIQGKIFKKFATKKTGGWGVGLYNTRVYVRRQGGEITYQSRKDVGTTFTVELPDGGA